VINQEKNWFNHDVYSALSSVHIVHVQCSLHASLSDVFVYGTDFLDFCLVFDHANIQFLIDCFSHEVCNVQCSLHASLSEVFVYCNFTSFLDSLCMVLNM
jgi:hypothetical protein